MSQKIENTNPSDWKDRQEIMQLFPISRRSLLNYHRKKIVPSARLGGKVFFYLPGILKILESGANR